MEETTTKNSILPETAMQADLERDNADINACVLEINKAMQEYLNPILQKYGCMQTFSVTGVGRQMQVQQIILKQK